MKLSPGARFRKALTLEKPLQIIGTINAYCAMMAEQTGYRAIYLSGAGVANASYGLPDVGMTNLEDVLTDVRRITSASDLPLLIDIDTGFGHAFGIARTIRECERAGVAAVHMEDQISAKRCGHRPNKALVTPDEMVDRIKAAVDARTDSDFVIMARSDALGVENMKSFLSRSEQYIEAGADMIFAEAVTSLKDYKKITAALDVPVLANITEFGKTPLFTIDELAESGVQMVLYPLTGFRAMAKACLEAYETVRQDGGQASIIDNLQTRQALYDFLNYHSYESRLDELYGKK